MRVLREYLWIGALAFGGVFVALGIFFLVMGMNARSEITARLVEQQIYTTADSDLFGVPVGTLVNDATTAQAQADVIKLHTLDAWGPWSSLERDDPRRASFATGVTLQSALGLAVLGYGVADLAVGSGAVIILFGLAILSIGVPALYWAKEAEQVVVKEVGRRAAVLAPAGGAD